MISSATLRRPVVLSIHAELLGAAAAIAIVLVVFFVVPQPLWNGHASGPHVAVSADTGWPGWLLAVAYALAWTLPFRPYVGALKLIDQAATQKLVLALTACWRSPPC